MTDALVREQSFRADRREVARARRFAVEAAAVQGRAAEDLALVTSELATNAVLHATSPFLVRVVVSSSVIRVEVRDDDPTEPVPRPGPHEGPDGRGISIVASIARRWGVVRDGGGKWVWAEVDRRP